jgi:hypothetical protein
MRELDRPDADVEALREQLADYDPVEVARWYHVGRRALNAQIDLYARQLEYIGDGIKHQRRLRQRSNDLARRQVPQLRKDWAALFPKRRCAHCNRLFVGRRDAKTCSTRCRTAMHRKRKD